jgi:hypothetical protein
MPELTVPSDAGHGMRELMHRLRRSGSASGALMTLAVLCVASHC